MEKYIYHKDKHLFFDELILLLATDISIAVAVDAYRHPGQGEIFSIDDHFEYDGSPHCCNYALRFYPYDMMRALSQNYLPTEIIFYKVDQTTISGNCYNISSTYGIHSISVQACFSKYFEKARVDIEKLFGYDTTKWPNEMNFARVIRNAFSHGGRINFINSNSSAVSWRELTYDPSMNGRQILYKDINALEIIVLMDDISKIIKGC
jgi:hypothetical protein